MSLTITIDRNAGKVRLLHSSGTLFPRPPASLRQGAEEASQEARADERARGGELERFAITLNRHCEERSDEAIQ